MTINQEWEQSLFFFFVSFLSFFLLLSGLAQLHYLEEDVRASVHVRDPCVCASVWVRVAVRMRARTRFYIYVMCVCYLIILLDYICDYFGELFDFL